MKTRIKMKRKFEDGVYKTTWYEAEVYDFWMVDPLRYQNLLSYFRPKESMDELEAYYRYPHGTLQFAQALIDDYIKHKKQREVKRTEEVLYVRYPYED